jgi:hypothetical protein
MSHTYTGRDEQRLRELRQEHTLIAHQQPGLYSLHHLFSDATLDIIDYCRDFRPNVHARTGEEIVKDFARHYDIWVENGGDHYNNMTAYLHPTPNLERLVAIGKAYAVLFYMNDTIGREKLGHMTVDQRTAVQYIIHNLTSMLDTGMLLAEPGPIERSAAVSLAEIRHLANPAWYQEFLTLMRQHLEPSFFDRNARAQGRAYSVEEYIDTRLHVSGMYATVALMEFGDDQYLDWPTLMALGLDGAVRRLRWLCAAIGALMNDMFSFEKEFVVENSDFNLISVVYLATPGATLHDAVHAAADIVRGQVQEFSRLYDEVMDVCARASSGFPAEMRALETHLISLRGSVQATWVWENDTERYKQQHSIFRENLRTPFTASAGLHS